MDGETKITALIKKEVLAFQPEAPLSKVINNLSREGFHEAPVIDDKGTLKGFFSIDLLARKKHIPLYTKVENVMVNPPRIGPEASISEAAGLMIETGFRGLPVVNGSGRVIGVLSRTDLIKALPAMKGVEETRADDILTPEPTLLKEDDRVERALELMVELNELSAPVVDARGRVAGAVLIDDISSALWNHDSGMVVGEVVGENYKPDIKIKGLVTPVATVHRDDDLSKVSREMTRVSPYICMVVDEDGQKPVGIITQCDVLKRLQIKPVEPGVYVDITGLEISDPFIYSSMISKLERFLKKAGRFSWISLQNLSIHVDRYHKGGRSKWSLKAKLHTSRGLVYVKNHGWDLLATVDELMDDMKKQVVALKKS